jgi:predicted metalloprotease
MRWEGGRRSGNVEDRRGMPVGRGVAGGGIGILVIALIAMFFGIDPRLVLEQGAGMDRAPAVETPRSPAQADPAEERMKDFVSVVLADTEDTWTEIFARSKAQYAPPKLVLFTGAVGSACGTGQAAMGPFYCPADRKVYIDLSFFRDLSRKLGAPGDFAQAYVIAHEVGHHIQNLLGIADKVHAARQKSDEVRANALSVRMELQADCFAGIWAHHADRSRQILESGDIEEGLNAAAAIGDDRLQKRAQGQVVPESFTHGSSAQRVAWFRRGIESGSPKKCDTFARGAG